MTRPSPRSARPLRGVAACYALPAGCSALLLAGATGLAAEPAATLFVVAAGWLTVAGFSRPPYPQLKLTWQLGARAALVLSLAGLAGTGVGLLVRTVALS